MTSTGNTPAQLRIVFNTFFEYPKTMKEVDLETNIMRENICRHVGALRKANRIYLVGYRKCKVTGFNRVGIYSTDPELSPKSNQLEFAFIKNFF
jgi:hypothetical protein